LGCLAAAFVLFFAAHAAAAADALKVHSVFSSNMVLQRDKPIKVWGWAQPGDVVTVTLGEQVGAVGAADEQGNWSHTFKPRPASSDPIKITVTAGDEKVVLENVLIGDVWVMSGQSNMAWSLDKTIERDLLAPQADLPQLRLMKFTNNEQQDLQKDFPTEVVVNGGWFVSTPEDAPAMSAIGYSFGANLQRSLGIPIGIIDTSRGGASIESLVPERKLVEDPLTKRYYEHVLQRQAEFSIDDWLANQIERWEKKVESEKKKGTPDNKLPKKPTKQDIRSWNIPGMSPSDAGSCYNGMFGVFIGYNIKGALFHQGFNNALGNNCRPKRYRTIMRLMVEGWREDFNDDALPVGVIGFCAGGTPQTAYNFEALMRSNGSYIRESQRLGLADVGDPERTAFLPAHDVQIPGLHPRKKADHGVRAARWALNRIYDMDVHWESAKLVSCEVVGDEIVLTFDKPVMPHDMAAIPEGFAITGEEGAFYKAYARFRSEKDLGPTAQANKYDTKTIHVWSPLVKKPVGVRYGWSVSPLANLYVDGMPWAPLHSFRTDSFDLPEDEDPAVNGSPGVNYRTENRLNAECNQERLAKEAEMAIQINERLKTLGIMPAKKN
jgi:sialate O-acetylesterase